MTQQLININPPGGGTGDTLYVAGGKINSNFTELYTTTSVTGLTVTLPSASLNKITTVTDVSGICSVSIPLPALSGIAVLSDEVNSNGIAFSAFLVTHNFGGSSAQGGRQSGVYLTLTSPTSSSNTNRNYVGWYVNCVASSNDGGTDLVSNSKGAFFAYGGAGVLKPNVTNIREVCWAEANVSCQTGSSVKYKNILSLVGRNDDVVQGTDFDCMLALSNQTGAVGFKDGILFGPMNSIFPVVTSGNLMRTIGGTVANGIDISNTTVSGSAFKSNGFSVDGSGVVTASATKLTITADGAVISQ